MKKKKILTDFQICTSVPLRYSCESPPSILEKMCMNYVLCFVKKMISCTFSFIINKNVKIKQHRFTAFH